jgi:hypothetical protein
MTERKIIKISQAQLDSWEWKEKAYESIKHLPVGERVKFIMERARATVEALQAKGVFKNNNPTKRGLD